MKKFSFVSILLFFIIFGLSSCASDTNGTDNDISSDSSELSTDLESVILPDNNQKNDNLNDSDLVVLSDNSPKKTDEDSYTSDEMEESDFGFIEEEENFSDNDLIENEIQTEAETTVENEVESENENKIDTEQTNDEDFYCPQFPKDSPNELIKDRHFFRGFLVVNPKTGKPFDSMKSGFSKQNPIWQFAFGNSISTLWKNPRNKIAPCTVKWEDKIGKIELGNINSSSRDFILAVNGNEQYSGKYYVPAEKQGWLYHLAQQQISFPGDYSKGSPEISALSELNFNIFAKLLKSQQNIKSGYNSTVHAAQFLIYFTVQNQNQSNKGFGDYLWFGITIYDDRYPLSDLTIMKDKGGTERLIYNVGNKPFISSGLTVGSLGKTFKGNILPSIRQALLEAWKDGFLQDSKDLSDYRIGGMNIGWEVSGLNNVSMQVKDLSLIYKRKSVKPLIFDFDKDGDKEGWTTINMQELTSGPKDGKWIFKIPENQTPYFVSPQLFLEAKTHKIIKITIANDHSALDKSYLRVYWNKFGDKTFKESWSKGISISNGGGWETITLDMSSSAGWSGEINQIRVVPLTKGDGHSVGFDKISFLSKP